MIIDSPLFGHGTGRFEAVFNDYQANYFKVFGLTDESYLADRGIYAFNEFLEIFSERGAIALILILFLIGVIIKGILKFEYSNVGSVLFIGSAVSVLTILVFGLFSYPLSVWPTLLNFIICLAVVSKTGNFRSIVIKTPLILRRVTNILVGLLMVSSLYYHSVTYQSYRNWKIVEKKENLDDRIKGYEALYPHLSTDGMFLLFYGQNLAAYGQPLLSNRFLREAHAYVNDPFLFITIGNNYTNLGQMQKAERAYWHAANMIPKLFYPKYYLAMFYLNSNQVAKCKVILKQIIEMKEKVPSKDTNEIRTWARNQLSKLS